MTTTTTSRYPSWLMKLVTPPNSADDEAAASRNSIDREEQRTPAQDSKHQYLYDPSMDKTYDASHDKSLSVRIDDQNDSGLEHRKNMQHVSAPQHQAHSQRSKQQTQAQRNKDDTELVVKLLRRLFTEFLGTFMLVWLIAVASVEFNMTNNGTDRKEAALNQTGAGLAAGISLSFLIWSMGHISGAHFNPCVTWAFAIRGMFPWHWVLPYWFVQFAGSLLSGAFVRAFYYDTSYLGSNAVAPQYLLVTGMFYEAVLTFIFVFTILSLATKGGNVGFQAALADGFALAVMIMLGHSYTGTSVNPFRSLGPGIVNGPRNELWVFVAGPFVGSTCSVLAVWLMNGPLKKSDLDSAQGKGEPEDN